MNEKKKIKLWMSVGGVLFAVSFALLLVARKVDGFAQWYSDKVYSVLVECFGRVFGIFPFSVVEILLYIFVFSMAFFVVRLVAGGIKKEKNMSDFIKFCSGLFGVASILFFIYTTNCGINYQKTSFSESAGIAIEKYTVEDLERVCELLSANVNELSDEVERDENGLMVLSENAQNEAVQVMENLADIYPEMEGYYPSPKGLIFPWILAVQQLSGIYSPFTVEANYNSGMIDYNIPFTMCHELSHLRGFMQEEEANFIAYLACIESENIEFQYSGTMLGWIYCMNVLYRVDNSRWEEIRRELDGSVEADLKANSTYWDKYEGQVAEMADKVNDSYLKANGQEDGVESYNRMVDLMVAYYKK